MNRSNFRRVRVRVGEASRKVSYPVEGRDEAPVREPDPGFVDLRAMVMPRPTGYEGVPVLAVSGMSYGRAVRELDGK